MARETTEVDVSESHAGCLASRSLARNQGVANPDNLPFMLRPQGAETAVLLVHGFTGTPWEMRLFADELAAAGIASYAVRLPGHGTSAEDLARRRWEEWQAAVAEGHRLLDREFKSVFGAGMSTGCLLLLNLAVETPLRGLILFSPYLRVKHRLAAYADWLKWVRPYHVREGQERSDDHYYSRRPVAGVHQINRLIRQVKRQLPQVSCPVLAFNGEGDETVEIDSGRKLVDQLGSKVRIYEVFGPEVPHVLTREDNPHRVAMFAQAVRFAQEIETPGLPLRTRCL